MYMYILTRLKKVNVTGEGGDRNAAKFYYKLTQNALDINRSDYTGSEY